MGSGQVRRAHRAAGHQLVRAGPGGRSPPYLAAIDVGITPYQNSPFNYALFPIKTLEYLSAGLLVVSTDLPGSRWLRDDLASTDPEPGQLLALAEDPAGFVAALRRMAGEPGGAAPAEAGPAAATPELAQPGGPGHLLAGTSGHAGPTRSRRPSGCRPPVASL